MKLRLISVISSNRYRIEVPGFLAVTATWIRTHGYRYTPPPPADQFRVRSIVSSCIISLFRCMLCSYNRYYKRFYLKSQLQLAGGWMEKLMCMFAQFPLTNIRRCYFHLHQFHRILPYYSK